MASTRAPVRPPRRPTGTLHRLAPGERRSHLLRAAADLMTGGGVDAVQVGDVAAAAGVSRQLVYKFFPSRQALIKAVLEDFADALTQEFGRRFANQLPADLEASTRVFIEAACDTIATKGAGPWHLLDSQGPDPEVGRLGQEIMHGLISPWHVHISRFTGIGVREAGIVARMLVAAGCAVLDLWCAGEIERDEAIRYATRGVSVLLVTFPTAAVGAAAPPPAAPRAARK